MMSNKRHTRSNMCPKMRILWTILTIGSLLQGVHAEKEGSSTKSTYTASSVTDLKSKAAVSAEATTQTSTAPNPGSSLMTGKTTNMTAVKTTLPTTNSGTTTPPKTNSGTTPLATTNLGTTTPATTNLGTTTPATTNSVMTTPATTNSVMTTPATTKSGTTTTPATTNSGTTTPATTKSGTTTTPATTISEISTPVISSPAKTNSVTIPQTTNATTTDSVTIPQTTNATTTDSVTKTSERKAPEITTPTKTPTETKAPVTTSTTTTTTTTTTNVPKPKTFNETVAANSTGGSLEKVCALFLENTMLNATRKCNIAGRIINEKYTITVVAEPSEEAKDAPSTDNPRNGETVGPLEKSDTNNMTLITILTSCGALALILTAFAVYCSCHHSSYRKNQQHLTEELQTVENGYHDNPTLEVMEVQPEMQEKKMALNGEFNDSWIVPFDNLAKEDIPEEEDTHL